MASSKYSSPPAPAIGKIGPYTVFLTPPPTPIPSQSPSPSPSPSPTNLVHLHPSPATPVRPPTEDSPRPPPPPVLPPPVQYAKPEDDDRFGFLSSAIARVLHVHSSVDEYVANWLGLNKSRVLVFSCVPSGFFISICERIVHAVARCVMSSSPMNAGIGLPILLAIARHRYGVA